MLESPHILPQCRQGYNCMAYQNMLSLHQHFLLGSGTCSYHYVQSHVAEKQQASALSLLAIYGTVKFYEETTHSPASYTHTHTHQPILALKWCHKKLCHLASSHALYFIVSHVIGIQLKDFAFISFYFCFLRHHTFPFTTWNFLAALELFS